MFFCDMGSRVCAANGEERLSHSVLTKFKFPTNDPWAELASSAPESLGYDSDSRSILTPLDVGLGIAKPIVPPTHATDTRIS